MAVELGVDDAVVECLVPDVIAAPEATMTSYSLLSPLPGLVFRGLLRANAVAVAARASSFSGSLPSDSRSCATCSAQTLTYLMLCAASITGDFSAIPARKARA